MTEKGINSAIPVKIILGLADQAMKDGDDETARVLLTLVATWVICERMDAE